MPRMNHLARAVSPDSLQPGAKTHDLLSRQTFCHLLGYEDISDHAWLQASLPIRLGGFGLTAVVSISPLAFVASWSNTIRELPNRFPDLYALTWIASLKQVKSKEL